MIKLSSGEEFILDYLGGPQMPSQAFFYENDRGKLNTLRKVGDHRGSLKRCGYKPRILAVFRGKNKQAWILSLKPSEGLQPFQHLHFRFLSPRTVIEDIFISLSHTPSILCSSL
jgi:hypothetical protein